MSSEQPLSQDDIDSLLKSMNQSGGPVSMTPGGDSPEAASSTAGSLSALETDTLVEISNILMGAGTSSLTVLLNQPVEVDSPVVTSFPSLSALDSTLSSESRLQVSVRFTKGIVSPTVYLLKAQEAKILADMILGGDGKVDNEPMNDLQLGGVTEAMSQMTNAAATSLASVISQAVDVSAPDVVDYEAVATSSYLGNPDQPVVQVAYGLLINNSVAMDIIQLWNLADIQKHIQMLLALEPDKPKPAPKPAAQPQPEAASGYARQPQAPEMPAGGGYVSQPHHPAPEMPMGGGYINGPAPQPAFAGGYGTIPGAAQHQPQPMGPVTVQPVQFSSFDYDPSLYGEQNKNLHLVMDVTLNMTVELGRTEIPIKEVLELTRGSVIELERLAGEPVDLMANGKLIAKGEVVVIEDNFGLRITSIVSPAERLRQL
jgi:flagellar motor switch protein FliN/FliY